ncbi:MAG: helicase-related protein, partial [Acidimicrobiales bacterium]
RTTGYPIDYNSISKFKELQLIRYNIHRNKDNNNVIFTQKDIIDAEINIPLIKKFIYILQNNQNTLIKLTGCLLDNLPGEEERVIMEMINADAIGTAAGVLKIKAERVGDIFSRLLRNDLILLMKYRKAVEFGKELCSTRVEKAMLMDKVIDIEKYLMDKKEIPEYIATNIINDVIIDIQKKIDGIMNRCDRIKSNIDEQECPMCLLPLKETDTIIMMCCGLILCSKCMARGSRLTKVNNDVMGKCQKCLLKLNIRNDIIYIDKANVVLDDISKCIDQNSIIDEILRPKDVSTNTENPDKLEENEEIEENLSEEMRALFVKSKKMLALHELMKEKLVETKFKSEYEEVNNILKGTIDKPWDGTHPRKFLILVNHEETMDLIIKYFDLMNNTPYVILSGTVMQIQESIELFKNEINILIINGSKYCAGINLQFVTDIIFMHNFVDTAVKHQLIGRAQRIGRLCNLNIHFLYYANENGIELK